MDSAGTPPKTGNRATPSLRRKIALSRSPVANPGIARLWFVDTENRWETGCVTLHCSAGYDGEFDLLGLAWTLTHPIAKTRL